MTEHAGIDRAAIEPRVTVHHAMAGGAAFGDVPRGVYTAMPNVARIYDYLLGGCFL